MSDIETALREIAAASSAAADRIDAAEADGRAALAGIAERIDALLHPTVSFAGTGAEILNGAWKPDGSDLWYYNDGAGWALGGFVTGNVAPPVARDTDAVLAVRENAGAVTNAMAQFQHFFGGDFDSRTVETIPEIPAGIVAAPLWLYDQRSPKDPEFDIEILQGNRIEFAHHSGGQKRSHVHPEPVIGRHAFGIRRTGQLIEYLIDDSVAWAVPDGDQRAVKPVVNIWMANGLTDWAGDPARPLAAPVEMAVHSWAFSGAA